MIETPVRMKCQDCGRAPVPAIYRLKPWQLAAAMTVALALGALTAALVLVVRWFGFFAICRGLRVRHRAPGAATGGSAVRRGTPVAGRGAGVTRAPSVLFVVCGTVGSRCLLAGALRRRTAASAN